MSFEKNDVTYGASVSVVLHIDAMFRVTQAPSVLARELVLLRELHVSMCLHGIHSIVNFLYYIQPMTK